MKASSHLKRLTVVKFFLVALVLALIARMVDLTVLDRSFLLGQGDARSLRVVDLPAYRGMITDRNGVPLAVSTPVQSVWVNPKEFSPDKDQFMALAQLIHVQPRDLAAKIHQASAREFLYLQRQLPPAVAKKIEALNIPGVNFQQEFKRFYPEAESASQVLGFTNVDDQGLEGIELVYQDWLMGVVGKKRVVKDRLGRVIEDLGVVKEPRPGHELNLSIDRRLQFYAFDELSKTVDEFGAKSGTVVVLDCKSGEILAMANAPSFNPNIRGSYDKDKYRNKAVTDLFEPGSVLKPFSIASALEGGRFTPNTIIETHPGWMTLYGRVVRDVHNYGTLDVTGVLKRSSNVGVTKMIMDDPPEKLINLLYQSGFGQKTETAFPGESEGNIVKAKQASPFVHATLGFGYGMSSTALQLAKAYMIFANQGKVMPVTLLHHDRVGPPAQVISAKTADQMLAMLEAVMSKTGTGYSGRVKGYRVAGKTGTARIAGKGGYKERRYISSFVGIAPVSDPRFVVVVIVKEPSHKGYYGAQVAAPLFAKVMGASLRMFDILPDAPEEE